MFYDEDSWKKNIDDGSIVCAAVPQQEGPGSNPGRQAGRQVKTCMLSMLVWDFSTLFSPVLVKPAAVIMRICAKDTFHFLVE